MPRSRNEQRGEATWMISFADVVSLMLTFFVMLYAMSTVDRQKWQEIAEALSRQPRLPVEQAQQPPTAEYTISPVFKKRLVNLDYLHAVIEEAMRTDPIFAPFSLQRVEDRLIIMLDDEAAFRAGRPVLRGDAQSALFALGGLLVNIANPVSVIGSADDKEKGVYTSGWELALARGAAISNALREAGYVADVPVFGDGKGESSSPAQVIVEYGVRLP